MRKEPLGVLAIRALHAMPYVNDRPSNETLRAWFETHAPVIRTALVTVSNPPHQHKPVPETDHGV